LIADPTPARSGGSELMIDDVEGAIVLPTPTAAIIKEMSSSA